MIGEILELQRLLKYRRLSHVELEELRNRKLRAVIHHAYEKAPYYRSLFQSIGLSPEDICTVEDLMHVPITTKEDLRAAGPEMTTAEGIDLSSCYCATTSGSTGEPFTIYLSDRDLRTRRLVEFRSLFSIGLHPFDRLLVLGSLNWKPRPRFHHYLGLYRSEYVSALLSVEEQIQILKRISPTILWAFPTVLKSLLHKVDYRLSELASPRILITSAEVLDVALKERVLSDLQMEIFNFYGTIETGRIASECTAHGGLHVNSDHVILECLDGDRPSEQGKPGAAIVTTLNNYSMPFIRYRLGDIFAYIKKTCNCGSYFPLIDSLHGREGDNIRLPSGKELSPLTLNRIVRIVDGIDQFRIIQESIDHFVVQLVLCKRPMNEILSKMRQQFLAYFGEPVKIDIQIVNFIKEEKLKFRTFTSKLSK